MGNNPSSLQQESAPRGRLQKKVSHIPIEIPHHSTPRRTPFHRKICRWRWNVRMRVSRAPSVRSIPGLWRHSIGPLQSVTKPELRVINCSEPPTSEIIDQCQVCVQRPEQGRRTVLEAQVESVAQTKDSLVRLSEKPEIAIATPENGRARMDLLMPCEIKSEEDPDRLAIIRHLEEAIFLTESFRALQRCKSKID